VLVQNSRAGTIRKFIALPRIQYEQQSAIRAGDGAKSTILRTSTKTNPSGAHVRQHETDLFLCIRTTPSLSQKILGWIEKWAA
jgi:hypothetical protein